MKKRICGRGLVVLLITAVLTANSSIKAFAATDPEVVLGSSNAIETTTDGIINVQIMPGDTVKQTFCIQNKSSQQAAFYMSSNMNVTDADGKPIKSTEGKTFKENLVRNLQLTLSTLGGTIIYEGPLSGDIKDATEAYRNQFTMANFQPGFAAFSDSKTGIGLGSIPSGGTVTLTAEISVPGDVIGNEYQNVYSLFNWDFYCVGEDYIPPKDEPLPVDPPTDIEDPDVPGGDIEDPDQPEDPDDPEDPDGTTEIEDEEVPESNINVIIDDEDVPEAGADTLAKTGFQVLYIKEVGAVLLVLIAGLAIVHRLGKKKVRK